MIFQAANKYNIDLENSWVVGDSKNDIDAGIAAKCKTALVSHENIDMGQLQTVSTLKEFVDKNILI